MITMPLARSRAGLCRLSYDPSRAPTWETPGLCRAFLDRDPDGRAVVTLEGTRPTVLGDWLRDLDQLQLKIDPALGPLPDGFGRDVLSVIFRIFHDLKGQPVGWNGHSKGGSECLIGAAIWKLAGEKLAGVTAFEPARVGLLGGLLDGEAVLITHVGTDPVPDVPPMISHPEPVTHFAAPAGVVNPIDCHEIDNVIAALPTAATAPQTNLDVREVVAGADEFSNAHASA